MLEKQTGIIGGEDLLPGRQDIDIMQTVNTLLDEKIDNQEQ